MIKSISTKPLVCPLCCNICCDQILINAESSYYAHCRNCNSIFLHDYSQIKSDKYSDFYLSEVKYDSKMQTKYGKMFKHFESTFDFNIMGKFDDKFSKSFLEIGFANPGVLFEASKKGWDCYGIDLSLPNDLKQEMEQKGIKCFKENILYWEPERQFRMIWITHLIEHFPLKDLKRLIIKLYNLLCDDGIIFISSPDSSLYGTCNQSTLINNFKPTEHYFLFTSDYFYSFVKDKFIRCFKDSDGGNINFDFVTRGEWRSLFKKNIK